MISRNWADSWSERVIISPVLLMLFTRFKLLLALLVALAATSWGPPTLAAGEPSASEISVARRLFDEGKAAEGAGRFAEAAEKFRKAIAIKDTPGLRFHVARCEEEQGAFVEALVEYDRARELIENGAKAADVAKLLDGAREKVRAKVAQLTLLLPKDVKNVVVLLDGKALSPSVLDLPMPINPGTHRIRAVAAGRTTFESELALGLGEERQLSIELPVTTSTRPPTLAAPPPLAGKSEQASARAGRAGSPARTMVLVAEASLFAVALTTGIAFTIAEANAQERLEEANAIVLSAGNSPDSACSMTPPSAGCRDFQDAGRDRARHRKWGTVGFVTAGASAAAFGLTLGLWPRGPARVRASAAADRVALSVSGRF